MTFAEIPCPSQLPLQILSKREVDEGQYSAFSGRCKSVFLSYSYIFFCRWANKIPPGFNCCDRERVLNLMTLPCFSPVLSP